MTKPQEFKIYTEKLNEKRYALIDVIVLSNAGQEECIAMIDTGAERSFLSPNLVKKLNLVNPIKNTIQGAGEVDSNFYKFEIMIPQVVIDQKLPVQAGEMNMSGRPFEFIIGCDLLKFFNFQYDGGTGLFSLRITDQYAQVMKS